MSAGCIYVVAPHKQVPVTTLCQCAGHRPPASGLWSACSQPACSCSLTHLTHFHPSKCHAFTQNWSLKLLPTLIEESNSVVARCFFSSELMAGVPLTELLLRLEAINTEEARAYLCRCLSCYVTAARSNEWPKRPHLGSSSRLPSSGCGLHLSQSPRKLFDRDVAVSS